MLKLLVNNDIRNNKNININQINCKNSCELFDSITDSCSIKQNVKVDNPMEVKRCGHFLPKGKLPTIKHTLRFTLLEGDDEYPFEDEDIFHDLIGKTFNEEISTYPLKPDFSAKREDTYWYISSCKTYGCWIINKSKNRFLSVPASGKAEMGWNKKVYKSPIPLHDHKTSLSLASKMAWVVDEDGFGQYALLVNGKISTLTSPRPTNWKCKY